MPLCHLVEAWPVIGEIVFLDANDWRDIRLTPTVVLTV